MPKKKNRRTCEICGVKEAHLGEPLFFANFPLNENRCKEWVRLTGNQDLVHVPIEKLNSIKHVCGNHFKKRDLNKHGNKLKKRAVPCLNLKFPPLSSEQMYGFPCHLFVSSEVTPSTSKECQGHKQIDVPARKLTTTATSTATPIVSLMTTTSNTEHPKPVVSSEDTPSTSKECQGHKQIAVPARKLTTTATSTAVTKVSLMTTTSNTEQPAPVVSSEDTPSTSKECQGYKQIDVPARKLTTTATSTATPIVSLMTTTSNTEQPAPVPLHSATTTLSCISAHAQTDHDYCILRTQERDISYIAVPLHSAMGTSSSISSHALTDHDYCILRIQEKDTPNIAISTSESFDQISRGTEGSVNVLTTSFVPEQSSSQEQQKVLETPTKAGASRPAEKDSRGVKRRMSESEELTPRKKKLVENLKRTKCTLKSLKKSAILIERIESPVLKELVINTCKNEKRKPKGRRWTTKHKISCLAILKRSPKTYRYLSSAVTLPSVKTLQNILKKVPLKSGICKSVLNHIKSISTKKNEKDKMCCLVFDEMAIKSRLLYNEAEDQVEGYEDLGEFGRKNNLADHALVFLIQGLHQKFKQPIAFYFTKGTISSAQLACIIKNIIKEVTACGFTIVNTVCDQGPTNMGALKILRDASGPYEDGANHYFEIDEKKIYIVYDIPHLFKSFRNNFLKAGNIVMNGKKGQWDHIMELETCNRNFLYLTTLTQAHVSPKYKAKMRVKLAAQVLSNTVSAMLKLMARAETGDRRNDFENTADVVRDLNLLFDATNGPSGPQDIKKGIRQNVSEKTAHMDQWAQFIKKLSNTKFVDRNGRQLTNVKCVNGYIISLKSLRDIWVTVNAAGFRYLNLRNLNQDALENLFGVIRQHSPTNRNPTAEHFIAALKTSIVTGLTAPHSRGANCEKDGKILLTDFQNFVFGEENSDHNTSTNTNQSGTSEPVAIPCNSENNEDIAGDDDFPLLSLSDDEFSFQTDFTLLSEQPTVYVAGYIARQVLKKIQCESCKNDLTVQNPDDNPIYSSILLREWWHNRFSLTYPSQRFCEVIKSLVEVTETELLPHLHEQNVSVLGCTLYSINSPNVSTCTVHGKQLTDYCFKKTCHLLIRRQCQRINQSLASKEEDLSDKNKKAEQQGKSK